VPENWLEAEAEAEAEAGRAEVRRLSLMAEPGRLEA
jgi:hypothetical protein